MPPPALPVGTAQKEDEEVAKAQEGHPRSPGPKEEICVYCANRQHDVCESHCRPAGVYSALVISPRETGEEIPRLPPMRELVTWPAAARLAVLHLVVSYLIEQADGR